jgi:hypothetical protein
MVPPRQPRNAAFVVPGARVEVLPGFAICYTMPPPTALSPAVE